MYKLYIFVRTVLRRITIFFFACLGLRGPEASPVILAPTQIPGHFQFYQAIKKNLHAAKLLLGAPPSYLSKSSLIR
jgi:hypothetical protein